MQTISKPSTPLNPAERDPGGAWASALAVLLGIAFTLIVRGYQFGGGNHNVYLLEPLRESAPPTLAHDWFTTQTLQYHGVFNRLCVWLMRLHILRPAFLGGYLGLVALLHAAWLRWVRALGGTRETYLLSVLLFYLSAGGIGLGMYDFFQDGSFLPSNIASVLMLAGLYCWVTGSRGWAGVWLGIAGLFHLNYGLVGIGMWGALTSFNRLACARLGTPETGERASQPKRLNKTWWLGTAALLALSIPNILPAVRSALSQSHHMPLTEFVALYVRVRHPHHYDPSTWPIALWISFLWPFPLAVLAAKRSAITPERRETYRMVALFVALLVIALLGAGVWYISEPLIQMSLFRFSVYPKLLTCIGAAFLLCGGARTDRFRTIFATVALLVAAVAIGTSFALRGAAGEFMRANESMLLLFASLCLATSAYPWLIAARTALRPFLATLFIPLALAATWHHLGLRVLAATIDSPDYLAVCDWARENTPIDAIFLVPPQEESFRLHGQRAVVVNFKCVPQFSGELGEWRDRLQNVLDLPDLRTLPHRFDLSIAAIGARYDALPAEHLEQAARQYGASYIVAAHPLPGLHGHLVFEKNPYRLYALDHP